MQWIVGRNEKSHDLYGLDARQVVFFALAQYLQEQTGNSRVIDVVIEPFDEGAFPVVFRAIAKPIA
jgi:hypothetical protein